MVYSASVAPARSTSPAGATSLEREVLEGRGELGHGRLAQDPGSGRKGGERAPGEFRAAHRHRSFHPELEPIRRIPRQLDDLAVRLLGTDGANLAAVEPRQLGVEPARGAVRGFEAALPRATTGSRPPCARSAAPDVSRCRRTARGRRPRQRGAARPHRGRPPPLPRLPRREGRGRACHEGSASRSAPRAEPVRRPRRRPS